MHDLKFVSIRKTLDEDTLAGFKVKLCSVIHIETGVLLAWLSECTEGSTTEQSEYFLMKFPKANQFPASSEIWVHLSFLKIS